MLFSRSGFKSILCIIIAVNTFSGCKKQKTVTPDQEITVVVSSPVTSHWFGFGFNQYPIDRDVSGNDKTAWNPNNWAIDTNRINYIKPSLVRINLYRSWFNPSGIAGDYDWNSPHMLAYYQVMDWYKSKNIPVMAGLWGLNIDNDQAYYTGSGQNSFQRLQTDLFTQLYITKGYTNIKWYTPTNEPKGTGMAFSEWSQMMHNTYSGFHASGLPTSILCGADSWDDWTKLAAFSNGADLQGYDHHYYLNAGSTEATSGNLQNAFKQILSAVKAADPGVKPVFLSESGFCNADSLDYWYKYTPSAALNPTTAIYGMLAFDYGIQVAASGQSGSLAWNLGGFDYSKDSGMWNISGQSTGNNLRPWFYSWSLLCRYFPAQGIISQVTLPYTDARMVALKQMVGNKAHWSFAIVNWAVSSKQLKVTVPGWQGGLFSLYTYSTSAGAYGDGSSLGLKPQSINIANMQSGFPVNIPAKSCILLTSMDNVPVSAE